MRICSCAREYCQVNACGKHPVQQIDGTKSMEEVFEAIRSALDEAVAKQDPLEQYCKDAPAADECRVYE